VYSEARPLVTTRGPEGWARGSTTMLILVLVLRQKRVQLGRRQSVLVISDADRLCQAESPASVGFGSLWKDACTIGLMATEREG